MSLDRPRRLFRSHSRRRAGPALTALLVAAVIAAGLSGTLFGKVTAPDATSPAASSVSRAAPPYAHATK